MNVYTTTLLFFFGFSNLVTALVVSRSSFLQQGTSSLIFSFGTKQPSSSLSSVEKTTTSRIRESADIFRLQIEHLIQEDPSLAGPLIRLAFHDATTLDTSQKQTTGGSNGSIQYELERSSNRGLQRPLLTVQNVLWNNTNSNNYHLSLADAIALAGATAVHTAGGPRIPIKMGRIDTTIPDPEFRRHALQKTTIRSKVETTLPSPGLDSDGLRLYFGSIGFTEQEFVALSGSHGLGRHVSLLGMSKECLKNLTRTCLEDAPVLLPFVTESVDKFDNSYFQYLLKWNSNQIELGQVAFIPTDVDLVVDSGLRRHVETFASNEDFFFKVYTRAFQKLVDQTATTDQRF